MNINIISVVSLYQRQMKYLHHIMSTSIHFKRLHEQGSVSSTWFLKRADHGYVN